MRKLSLVQQFSLILFVTLLVVGIFFGKLLTVTMKQDMLDRSNEIIAGFIKQEINKNLQLSLFVDPGASDDYEKQARHISSLNLGPDIIRIKMWNSDKAVVWSSNKEDIGQQNLHHHELEDVFAGSVISEISSEEHVKEKYAMRSIRMSWNCTYLFVLVPVMMLCSSLSYTRILTS